MDINRLGLILHMCMVCTCELTPSKFPGHFFDFHTQITTRYGIWFEFHSSEQRIQSTADQQQRLVFELHSQILCKVAA